jgi:chromosome segregation ATPase
MLAFIRNLLGVKSDQAVQGAVEALVRWDPKAATEAELRTMEQHLDRLGRQVAEARQAYEREQREADVIQRLSEQRMAAAEQLQARAQGEADPARKAELEQSLATLVNMLEQMAPDLDREKQDAVDANDFLRTLENAYAQAGQKLKSARDALNRAQRDMGRAEQQRDVAERRAEAAREAAGLSSATSGLSVALKAMQDNAARNLAEAEAANAKAKLLQPSRPEQEDRNIAEAMRAASGAGAAPTTLGDRLAALRQRQMTAPAPQLEGPKGG